MPYLAVHDAPGATKEMYEEIAARLTDGGSLESLSDWPVEGILMHAAGPTDDGWQVVDVWESAEAFEAFGEVIRPLLQEFGMGGRPVLSRLHNFVK